MWDRTLKLWWSIRRLSCAIVCLLGTALAGRADEFPCDFACDGTACIPWCESACDGCGPIGGHSRDFALIGRGGLTYTDVPGESQLGGTYGAELAVHVQDAWGFVGSFDVNHLQAGAQLLGSLGVVRLPDAAYGIGTERVSFALFFDQFTDTRIDTIEHGLYLNQLRLLLGYAVSPKWECGAIYTEPTNRDDDVNFLFLNFPTSLPIAGQVDLSRSVIAYSAVNTGTGQWSVSAGHRFRPGTFLVSGSVRRPVSDHVALLAGGTFEERRENWASFVGLELHWGGGRTPLSCVDSRSQNAYVCRAQSPDSRVRRTYWVPTDQPTETPGGEGTFERGLGDVPDLPLLPGQQPPSPDEFAVAPDFLDQPIPPDFEFPQFDLPTSRWSERYINWAARLPLMRPPHEAWRGLNADGITNDAQKFQENFSRFSLKTRGGATRAGTGDFGRTDGRSRD